MLQNFPYSFLRVNFLGIFLNTTHTSCLSNLSKHRSSLFTTLTNPPARGLRRYFYALAGVWELRFIRHSAHVTRPSVHLARTVPTLGHLVTLVTHPRISIKIPPARAQAPITVPVPCPGVHLLFNPCKPNSEASTSYQPRTSSHLLTYFFQIVQQPLLSIHLTRQGLVHVLVDRVFRHNHVDVYRVFLPATRKPLVRL